MQKKISGENTSALLLLKRRRRDTKRLSFFARECGNAPRVLVDDDHKDDLCRRLSKYSRSFVSFVRAFVLRKMKRASSLVGVAREKAALLVQGDDDVAPKKKRKRGRRQNLRAGVAIVRPRKRPVPLESRAAKRSGVARRRGAIDARSRRRRRGRFNESGTFFFVSE